MAKVELPIKITYAADWGIPEGIRESVQNGLDGADEGYPLDVAHEGGWLKLTNLGCRLDKRVWLLGHTTKRGTDQRGQHGDGLKVGTLALLRAGVEVKIYNGEEIWTPKIARSESFGGEKILVIQTRKRRVKKDDYWGDRHESDFSVHIRLPKANWEGLRDNFLPLADVADEDVDRVRGVGAVLKGDRFRGRIYSKGIFVCTKRDLELGYDFQSLSLDRDRRMVDDWDLGYAITDLMDGLARGKDGAVWGEATYQLLKRDVADVADLYTSHGRQGLVDSVTEAFIGDWGPDCIPVADGGQADKAAHYGLRPVEVPKALGKVLERSFGTFDSILRKAVDDSGEQVPIADLTDAERATYTKVLNLVYVADVADLDTMKNAIRIYEFSCGEGLLGTHHGDTGEIRIRRDQLADKATFLGTVIHEVCHADGMGNAHAVSMEKAWEAVTRVLLECADLGSLLD